MTKHRVFCLLIVAGSLIGLASAQSSKTRSSSNKSAKDPLQTATKPLTPKSAMPNKRKSAVVTGGAATTGRNTTAELTHLERQNVKAGSTKTSSTPAKVAPAAKPADTSAKNGSQINFQYQKPVGGPKATTPATNSSNSGAPRVKKN